MRESVFERLATCTPSNSTAASVVSQKGCVDELTLEQEYENILSARQAIEKALTALDKEDPRREKLKLRLWPIIRMQKRTKKEIENAKK